MPTEISTVQGLKDMANDLTGNYILTADINLNNEEWLPVGNYGSEFTGVLDGNGYTISNLKITAANRDSDLGLFGDLSGAVVKNLTLDGVTLDGEGTRLMYVGGLVGFLVQSELRNCLAKNVYIRDAYQAGGLVGKAYSDSIYLYDSHVKGLDAMNHADYSMVGGIAGNLEGNMDAPDEIVLEQCSAAGLITGQNECLYTGGLVGFAKGDSPNSTTRIKNCYSQVDMAGSFTSYESDTAAGLVGYPYGVVVENSYTAADLTDNVFPCVPDINNNVVTGCYYDQDRLTNPRGPDLAAGRTTEEMTQYHENTYEGWDLIETWTKKIGEYPYFSDEVFYMLKAINIIAAELYTN